MGWKMSTIIVNTDKEFQEKELLKALGYTNIKSIENKTFDAVMNPDNGVAYIGSYKGNTIICISELPMTFLEPSLSEGEKVLIDYFPNAEICTLMLQSVVNFWAYAVIKNGQKIRLRGGTADAGTMLDFGEPLEEELDLLSKSKLDEEGNRIYFFEEFGDESFQEDQVGENFVFTLTKKYTGEELDRDDEIFEIQLNGYSIEN